MQMQKKSAKKIEKYFSYFSIHHGILKNFTKAHSYTKGVILSKELFE